MRRRRSSQRGTILLQASFFILVLMGLAALTFDLGIVRATQGFMQVSADSASLEGLRQRDAVLGNPENDRNRRADASAFAALVFDEDVDDTTAPDAYLLGAGPVISTGVGGVNDPAGGLLVADAVYVPQLELNLGNEVHGDLVAGTYTALDPVDAGNPDWHVEDGTYLRADFTPAAAGDAASAPAFLARLRRTNDTLGLDAQAGVSSSGPTLPFLLGLGSGVLSTDDPSVYDPRRDGIAVRATAIADARPAVAVGIASDVVEGLGVAGTDSLDSTTFRVLAFNDASWSNELATSAPFEVTVSAYGTIDGSIVGFAHPERALVRVGDEAVNPPSGGPGDPVDGRQFYDELQGRVGLVNFGVPDLLGRRYVALYGGGEARIVGFAAVRIDTAILGSDGGVPVLTLRGVKLPSLVAPENASAVPMLAADVTALPVPSPTRAALLAPVLAR